MARHSAKRGGQAGADQPLEELIAEEEARQGRKHWFGNLFWGLFGLFLLAALGAQYAWFTQRDRVLQDAQIRPWLDTLCRYTGCQLPVTRALDQLKISNNFMGKHETQPDAVLLHFIFANDAPFPQPYPGVEIRFEDEANQVIGIRRLAPADYAAAGADLQQLPPHQPVHVNLELHNAVQDMHTFGYSIHFL